MRLEILLISLFVVGGYSLRCHVCDTEDGQTDCGSADTLGDQYLQECADDEPYCRRIEYNDRIVRTCSKSAVNVEPWCLNDDKCASTGTCSTDGCNHGNGIYIINHILAIVGLCFAYYIVQ